LKPADRQWFDKLLEEVMAELPAALQELIEEVPVVVEDHPSAKVLREMDIHGRDDLCGLHTGVPLTERSVEFTSRPPEAITIYRRGVLDSAADEKGQVSDEGLREQIRITLLHEIGHHFGMSHEEMERLGYD
jgi:predicted Zn-dependent protease with MMP-like domain